MAKPFFFHPGSVQPSPGALPLACRRLPGCLSQPLRFAARGREAVPVWGCHPPCSSSPFGGEGGDPMLGWDQCCAQHPHPFPAPEQRSRLRSAEVGTELTARKYTSSEACVLGSSEAPGYRKCLVLFFFFPYPPSPKTLNQSRRKIPLLGRETLRRHGNGERGTFSLAKSRRTEGGWRWGHLSQKFAASSLW